MPSMVEDLHAVFSLAEERPDWAEGFIDGLEQAVAVMRTCMTKDLDADKGVLVLDNTIAVLKEHIT